MRSARVFSWSVLASTMLLGSYNCLLVGAPVVASGTAHLTGGIVGRQASMTLHGIVDLVGGGQARLFVTTITHFGPDGSIVFDHTRIRLTPL